MPVGFDSNSSLPNPLERFAKPDGWNSYLSATDKPENILEDGFTEVGLLTKIFETLKEAFGFESSMSNKALGDRLITVLDLLEANKVQVDEKYLTTLVTVATRAKVFGNKDEKKNYKPLTDRFTALDAEVKQLQALIISEVDKAPTLEDEFILQDDASEDLVKPPYQTTVEYKKVEAKRTILQPATSSSPIVWKAVKLASVAAVITIGAFMATKRWDALEIQEGSSSTALVALGKTGRIPPQCDLDEARKAEAKAVSLIEDDPTYANPKFRMLSDYNNVRDYVGAYKPDPIVVAVAAKDGLYAGVDYIRTGKLDTKTVVAGAKNTLYGGLRIFSKINNFFFGDIDRSIHRVVSGFIAHIQPKGVVFAAANRQQYNNEAAKIVLKGLQRVRENPLNEYDPAMSACEERHALKEIIREQGTEQAKWFAESLDWMRHGVKEGLSCDQLWTKYEKLTTNSTETARLLVLKSGEPNKDINGLSRILDWADYPLELAKQNTASIGFRFHSLYKKSVKKLNEVYHQVNLAKLLNGPRNSVV